MCAQCPRSGTDVLFGRALRFPLPDAEAERRFAERMQQVADGRERKADLLADSDVPALEAYEVEREGLAAITAAFFADVGCEDYVADAADYARGVRDDPMAEAAAYAAEGLWMIEERTAHTEMTYAPLVLRYPNCFTVNLRFAEGHRVPGAVVLEAPQHADAVNGDHAETYYAESARSQREAATYVRESAQVIRDAFPRPEDAPFEERAHGGFAYAAGRRGSALSERLVPADPDPDRFDAPADGVAVVPEGPAARRTERSLLAGAEIIA